MDLAIVIVTYNSMHWLSKCLESTRPFPVIVVDNNSEDKTVEFIENNHPHITLLKQKRNLGFGEANNVGIAYALQQNINYIFLLNQDAYLEKVTIPKLMEIQQRNSDYGVLSPVHLTGKGDRLDRNFSLYVNYDANPDFYSDHVLRKSLKEVYEVPFVNAAGWLISRKCLETVGGFDPIFFHYGEDENYCHRLKYFGYKIGIVPTTKLYHDRENRLNQEINSDQKYFQNLEKQLKIKYADPNLTSTSELDQLISRKKMAWIKSLFKFSYKKAAFYKAEYLIVKRVRSLALNSREQNKSSGSTFLTYQSEVK